MTSTKRLRIFAGPNGSGKSTILQIVKEQNVNLGIYVNADNIKKELDLQYFLDFTNYSLTLNIEHLKSVLQQSSFYDLKTSNELIESLTESNNRLYIEGKATIDNIFPSFIADYIRNLLLSNCDKFTFETVMSHPSKLEFIQKAKVLGYRSYLYFVSLENPIMNIARVEARVKQGGHDVPRDKIVSRYERTMSMLLDVIKMVDKAYLFDNSGMRAKLFAISENDKISIIDSDYSPVWFQKYVLDKL